MSRKGPIEISCENLLIVEGDDDELFFYALAQQLGLHEGLQIYQTGGKYELPKVVAAVAASYGFRKVKRLGIIRDADEDPEAAFKSVVTALEKAKLPVPSKPREVTGSSPRVSVFILPAEDRQGALEDLCLEAVKEDPAMACVEGFFQCLETQGVSKPTNIVKAKVQIFLASRPEPGKRLGHAAQAGYWPWDSQVFEPVKEFLRCLLI